MTTTAMQRRPRCNPVDVSHFHHQIEQALLAFEADVTYAVAIARAAVTIHKKRNAR